MIVDSAQKRTGGLRTTNRTHRISRPWPIVILAGVSAGEGAGNV
jgi:hypothetical protein